MSLAQIGKKPGLTKREATTLRRHIENYAEAYEEYQNKGRYMPKDMDEIEPHYRKCKKKLDDYINRLENK